MDDDLPPPIPAATLILMRPADDGGAPEILMMERAANMAFAAGALVFPGGRIEPEDHASAAALGADLPNAPARIAAVRETIEEAGVAACLPASADARSLRAALAKGEPFHDVLARLGLTLDLAALTPFARWCPNFREARRFDAFFYVAEAPVGAAPASADQTEAVRVFWSTAEATLAEIDAGRAHAIFPTRRNLERLAGFGSFAEARQDALRYPVQRITPWVEERGGERFVCIPEGIGYPVTAEPYSSARRR